MSTANRNFRPVRSLSREHVFVTGTADISSSSVVSNVDCLGATLATTGAGEFTLTMTDKYAQFCGADMTIVGAAATGNEVRIQTADVSGAGTITFRTVTSGNTAVNPGANVKLHFTLSLRRVADKH